MSYFEIIYIAEVILLPFVVLMVVRSGYLFLRKCGKEERKKAYESRRFKTELVLWFIIAGVFLALLFSNLGNVDNVVFPLASLLVVFLEVHFTIQRWLKRIRHYDGEQGSIIRK